MAGRSMHGRLRGNGGVYVPPVDPLAFNALNLSVTSFAEDALEGDVLATITGFTTGSTRAIVGTTAYTISGNDLLRGTGSYPVSNQLTIRESKALYTTLDNVFHVTIVEPEAPPGDTDRDVDVRYNGRAFVDLSAEIAAIHDSNMITLSVSGPGGQLIAMVHNMRNMVSGETMTFVHRELMNYFAVELSGAARGSQAGVLTISGYSGAGDTGTLITGTVGVNCLTNFPSAITIGADTRAREGSALELQHHVPDPENWSIQSQTATAGGAGYVEIIRDTTGGRNIHRIVLAGTMGQNPATIPTAGVTSNTITLVHTSALTKAMVLTCDPDTADLATWSLAGTGLTVDVWTTNGTNQTSRWLTRTKKFPFWGRWATGDYNPANTYGYFNLINGANNVALPTTNRPSGPFGADLWTHVYSSASKNGPGPNPKYMKLASREPWGARWGFLIVNTALLNTATSATIGLETSNFTLVAGATHQVYNQAAPYIHPYNLITHHHIRTEGNSIINVGTPNNGSHLGCNFFDNYMEGALNFAALDSKRFGNRWQTAQTIQDSSNNTVGNSTLGSGIAEICWELHIHKQGQISPVHEDQNAFRFNIGAYAPGGVPTYAGWFEPYSLTYAEFDVYGCAIVYGGGYTVTQLDVDTPIATIKAQGRYGDPSRSDPVPAVGTQMPSGQNWFLHDILAGKYARVRWGGLLMNDQVSHGITQDNAAVGTSVQYCTFLYPAHLTNAYTGASPQGLLQSSSDAVASPVPAKKNICARDASGGNLAFGLANTSGNTPSWAQAGNGNVYGVSVAQQLVMFNNPAGGPAFKDIADVAYGFGFKAGQEVDAGAFPPDTTIIDWRRRRVDKARLFAT